MSSCNEVSKTELLDIVSIVNAAVGTSINITPFVTMLNDWLSSQSFSENIVTIKDIHLSLRDGTELYNLIQDDVDSVCCKDTNTFDITFNDHAKINVHLPTRTSHVRCFSSSPFRVSARLEIGKLSCDVYIEFSLTISISFVYYEQQNGETGTLDVNIGLSDFKVNFVGVEAVDATNVEDAGCNDLQNLIEQHLQSEIKSMIQLKIDEEIHKGSLRTSVTTISDANVIHTIQGAIQALCKNNISSPYMSFSTLSIPSSQRTHKRSFLFSI